jgi:hypothetical protein
MYKWERREKKLDSKRRRIPKHGRGLKTRMANEEARFKRSEGEKRSRDSD